jgi:hypothetical protein
MAQRGFRAESGDNNNHITFESDGRNSCSATITETRVQSGHAVAAFFVRLHPVTLYVLYPDDEPFDQAVPLHEKHWSAYIEGNIFGTNGNFSALAGGVLGGVRYVWN